MKIVIVGGAGQMGVFFLRYFKAKGHSVVITDVKKERSERLAMEEGVDAVQPASKAVVDADLVLVSVPIEAAPGVIAEIAPQMTTGSMLMEITSVKRGVVEALKSLKYIGVKPLSIHPLFGPGAKGLEGNRIAVIPILDSEGEVQRTREIFGEAEIVPVDADEHDRAMTFTITLTYLLNAFFASALEGEDLSRLRELGGPAFQLQLLLCEAMMSQDPNIYESIIGKNLRGHRVWDELQGRITDLLNDASTMERFHERIEGLREELTKDPLFRDSYEDMYKALIAVRKQQAKR